MARETGSAYRADAAAPMPAGEAQAEKQLHTVTELARELGVTARSIRFYEDKGLIAPQRAGSTRVYTARDRARMILILRGKRLGFSLREIKEYLDLYGVDVTQREQLRLLMKSVRTRIVRLIEQRTALDQTLTELRNIEAHGLAALSGQPSQGCDLKMQELRRACATNRTGVQS